MGKITIQKMTKNHLHQVASIHAMVLPNDLLPNLGMRFLEKYYNSIVNSPYSEVMIAIDNSKVVGFINLSFAPELHMKWIMKKNIIALAFAIFRLSFFSPNRVLEALSVSNIKPDVPIDSAEISFIAVTPFQQKKGIGRQLVEEAHNILWQKKIQYIFTKTLKSNNYIQKIYKKNWNAEIIQEVQIKEKEYVYLLWQVPEIF